MTKKDVDYNLNAFRPIYPVVYDVTGKRLIDGRHRLKANPNWPKMKLEDVKTDEDILLARAVLNLSRRQIPVNERKRWMNDLAAYLEKQGFMRGGEQQHLTEGVLNSFHPRQQHLGIVAKIVEITGFTKPTVLKYIDRKYVGEPCQPKQSTKRRKSHRQDQRTLHGPSIKEITKSLQATDVICPYCKKPSKILVYYECCNRKAE